MGGTPHWRRGHLAWLQAAARTNAAERERCAAIVERWNAAPTHDWSPAIGTALKAGYRLGGPGRPKGSRNKLGEAFLADVYESWQKHGAETLERMIQDDPGGFVRVVANILPDKLEVDVKHTISRIERIIVDRVMEHGPLRPPDLISDAPSSARARRPRPGGGCRGGPRGCSHLGPSAACDTAGRRDYPRRGEPGGRAGAPQPRAAATDGRSCGKCRRGKPSPCVSTRFVRIGFSFGSATLRRRASTAAPRTMPFGVP
jgi:hypothetical protein